MAKLIGAGAITSYVPKMIELRHGYIINGQYYTGEEMQAVPFCTPYNANFVQGSNLAMFLTKSFGTGSKDYSLETSTKNIFYDKFDTEVSYIYCSGNHNYANIIMKVRETKEECKIEAVIYPNHGGSHVITLVDIQQQEPDKITFLYNAIYTGSTSYMMCYTYNTLDLSIYKNDNSLSEAFAVCASKIDDNLYFVTGRENLWVARMKPDYSVDYVKTAITSFYSSWVNSMHIVNSIKTETDEEVIYNLYYYKQPTTAHVNFNKQLLVTITINKATNVLNITYKEVTTDTTVPVLTKNTPFFYGYFIEGSTKKYLVNFISNYSAPGPCFFNLYEVLEDDNLKVLKSYQIAQNVALNLLFKNNGKRVLIPSMTGVGAAQTITRLAILDWNEAKEDFVVTKTIEDSIQTFGYNKNDELFVMKKDTSIDKYNDTSVAAFNAVFAESYYRYQGENILTHITCSVTNLEDEKLAKKVFLELEGAAYFTDNNKKEIEFMTSTTEVTTINVTISGPGAINIYPKIEA